MSIVQAAIALAAVAGFVLIAALAVAVLIAIAQAFLPCRDDGGLEALIDATREDIPDYVPDEWTEEYNP